MTMIHEKIIDAMKDIEAIGKNRKNSKQEFNFRGIDDVYNSLHPILAKHDLFTMLEVLEEKSEERESRSGGALIYRILKIKYTVYTTDGSFVHGIVIGEGMDSGDKATNKAMSIAHKYFLMQLFCIPTGELIDPDAESHEILSIKKECETMLDGAKNPEALKQAFQYCNDILKKHNVSDKILEEFRQYANQVREKLKQSKEEINNETK